MIFTPFLVAALASLAQAVDVHVVYVGMNPVNNVTASKFWPEKIQAAPGSMVQFQFWAGNHTVTQSSFGSPCTPMTQTSNGTAAVGIKSGFQPVAASERTGQIPTYSVMINDTSPLWFYCGQGAHCQGGMAMVINESPNNAERTLDAYKTSAASLSGDGSESDSGPGSGSGDGTNGEEGPSEIPGEVGDDEPARSGATLAVVISKGALMAAAGAALLLW